MGHPHLYIHMFVCIYHTYCILSMSLYHHDNLINCLVISLLKSKIDGYLRVFLLITHCSHVAACESESVPCYLITTI